MPSPLRVTVGPEPSLGPTTHEPHSARGSPVTPSAAAIRAAVSAVVTLLASNPYAVALPPSVDRPLPVNTVRPNQPG